METEVKEVLDRIEAGSKKNLESTQDALKRIGSLEENIKNIQENGGQFTKQDLEDARKATEQVKEFLAIQGRKGAESADKVVKTFGGLIFDLVGKSQEIIDSIESGRAKTVALAFDKKAVADMTLGNNLSGNFQFTYRPGIVEKPFWPVHLRDLVAVTPSATDSYHFYRHTGGEGAIDWQSAEGATKPQIDQDFLEVIINLRYLAGFLVISRQMLRNMPALQAYLSRWLPEQYYQTEDAKGYAVLSTDPGLTPADSTGTNSINKLLITIGILESLGYIVTGIVVNPKAWARLLTNASTEGVYTMPGAVVVTPQGSLSFVGIPIYKANWVPDDTAVLGDWRYFEIIQSEGLSLRFSEEDNINFRQNKITARIEASIGFAVLQPAAFSILDLGEVA